MEFFIQFEVLSVYTVIDVAKLTADIYIISFKILVCHKHSVYTIVYLGSKLDFFLGDQSPQGIFLF